MAGTPEVSIIVPSYNTAEATAQAVRSIHDHTQAEFEVVVVDDASADGSPVTIREMFPGARVIVQPERRGFSAACNAGIRNSSAPLVLLLNSDIVLTGDAIDRMLAFMRDGEAAACGSRLVAPDGSPQTYSTRVPQLGDVMRAALGSRTTPGESPQSGGPRQVECLQGSCMMIRRKAIEQAGMFDEGFFLYCEDIDWCIRARAAGLGLFYLPDIVMIHHRGLSTSRDVWRLTLQYHLSLWRLYRKHFARQHNPFVSIFACAGLTGRCLATLGLNLFRRNKRPRW